MKLKPAFFDGIRDLIAGARTTVARGVDLVQVHTNFEIGRRIVEEEQRGKDRAAYGKEVIKALADRLTAEFGKGFSTSNLAYMRTFYLLYEDRSLIFQTPSGKSGPPDACSPTRAPRPTAACRRCSASRRTTPACSTPCSSAIARACPTRCASASSAPAPSISSLSPECTLRCWPGCSSTSPAASAWVRALPPRSRSSSSPPMRSSPASAFPSSVLY